MVNDTTTLNGSLRELGELMANNLTEQGVASTYDEGLTTLANKILDIQGIPSTLTLTSDKSILSYHDRDTCTLTATLTGNDVANKTVEFFNGSTSLGTATTNSTGVATKTYTSQGIGDIEIFARVGTLVSEICSVEDCLRYDLATSDKTSSYGACITYRGSGTTTWSYIANNGYHISIVNSTEGMVVLSELTGKNDFTVEFDVKMKNMASDTSNALGFCAYEDNNNNSRIGTSNIKTSQRICINGTATESESNLTNSINSSQLIHFKYTITDNQIVEEITQGTTSIGTRTISYNVTANTKFGICGVWQKLWAERNYFKNIKVKPL